MNQNCSQNSVPQNAFAAGQRSPDPLAGFRGKGKGNRGRKGGERKGMRRGRGREGEGREPDPLVLFC